MFSNEGLGVQGMIGGQQKGQAKAGGHDYSTAGRRRVWASRTQINGLRQRAARGEGGSQYLIVYDIFIYFFSLTSLQLLLL
jgi:hypothetical protein